MPKAKKIEAVENPFNEKVITAREKMVAATRLEFINALSNGHYDIEHKVNVHDTMMNEGGHIDYNDELTEFSIENARLSKKKDGEGGFFYHVKITVK